MYKSFGSSALLRTSPLRTNEWVSDYLKS